MAAAHAEFAIALAVALATAIAKAFAGVRFRAWGFLDFRSSGLRLRVYESLRRKVHCSEKIIMDQGRVLGLCGKAQGSGLRA